ncbi:MAG: DUF5753 domain-containing protein [Pseudonocardia sp.]
MSPVSPVVATHELGRRLRERRETLGLAAAELARAARCTPQFLSQVETGKKIPALEKLTAIFARLEIDEPEMSELLALREQGVRRGPYAAYSGIFSTEILRFFGFEHGAESIFSFGGGLIHGLLQTQAYARAVIQAGGPYIRQAEVERRVQARLARQARLDGPDPISLTVVMTEAAIRQQVGGPEVLAQQLTHVVEQVEACRPRLDVRVIPFSAAGHPALGSSTFHLLGFPSGRLPTMLWLETVTTTDLIDDPAVVHEYQLTHAGALDVALDLTDSLGLITSVAKDLR